LLYPQSASKVISLTHLLNANVKVNFEVGRPRDPQFGGTIPCPDGTVITMVYAKGTWRLPTLTLDKASIMANACHIETTTSKSCNISDSNPWKGQLDMATAAEEL